ncbi:MAG: addiction module antidote protein, HigA family [Cyanobacteria bacterium P01_F01_bin.143]
MTKRQWIKPTESLNELEQSICEFLDITSPQDTPQLSVNFRHSPIPEAEYNAKIAWCKRVEQLASKQKLKEFQLDRLKEAIPHILSHAEREEDVASVPQLLMDLGVHFIIVKHLNKTYLDGAAFYFRNHPVVALTLRHNRIDYFWFSLMQELGYIIAGHQGIYLNNLEDLEANPEEEKANKLARNWLIDEKALNSFIVNTQPKFSKKAIANFAHEQNKHPGIILGRLQHEGLVPYSNLRMLLVKVKPFLSEWIYD